MSSKMTLDRDEERIFAQFVHNYLNKHVIKSTLI